MAEVQEVSEEVYLGEGFQEDLAIKARDQTAEKRLNAGDLARLRRSPHRLPPILTFLVSKSLAVVRRETLF